MNNRLKSLLIIFLLFSAFFVYPESEDVSLTREGVSLFKAGEYQKAIAVFEQAVAVNPDNFQPYQYSAMAYLKIGDKETALLQFERAYSLYPTPGIKASIDNLKKSVRGCTSLSTYPVTFDVVLSFSSAFLNGSGAHAVSSSYFSNFGICALINYSFNDLFSLGTGLVYSGKSGGLKQSGFYYSSSYLKYSAGGYDFPLFARFRFLMPWSDRSELSIAAGPYVGILTQPKAEEYYYGDTTPSGISGFVEIDSGISIFLSSAFYWGKFSVNIFELVSFGLTKIHPDYDAKTCIIMTGLGIGF